MLLAVVGETLDRCLDEAKPSIQAIQFDILDKILQPVEEAPILRAQNDFEFRPFVKNHVCGEISHYKRDGSPEIAVGWIAQKPGTGIGGFSDQSHFRFCTESKRSGYSFRA